MHLPTFRWKMPPPYCFFVVSFGFIRHAADVSSDVSVEGAASIFRWPNIIQLTLKWLGRNKCVIILHIWRTTGQSDLRQHEKGGAYSANRNDFQKRHFSGSAVMDVLLDKREVMLCTVRIAPAFCMFPNRWPWKVSFTNYLHSSTYMSRFWNALPFAQYWPHSSPIPRNQIGQFSLTFPFNRNIHFSPAVNLQTPNPLAPELFLKC